MSATQLKATQIRTGNGLTSTSGNLIVNLDANGGLEFNSGATRIKLDSNPGLVLSSSGAKILLDGSTLSLGASGLKISDDGVGKDQLGILTTNGDILVYGAEPVRFPVGSNGQYLTVNTSNTPKLEWVTFSGLTTTNFVFNEVPSGDLDGVDTTYTIANAPTAGTLQLFLNGVLLTAGAGNDYTLSGTTITFATAPISTDVLLAHYMK